MNLKQLFSTAFLLLVFASAFTQTIQFTDQRFKNALIGSGIDLNNDGEIQISEAEQVDSLFVINLEITSLRGIEYFINLDFLDCSKNNIGVLYLSKNIKLSKLRCENNNINYIDATGLDQLKVIDCSQNQLRKIFTNELPNLQFLDISNNTIIDDLKITNQKLYYLDVSDNNFGDLKTDSIAINDLKNLEELHCSNLKLNTIDLSQNTKLRVLECNSNKITELNLSKNPQLQIIKVNSNSIDKIDVSNQTELKQFAFQSNKIEEVDFSNNKKLRLINFRDNKLKSFDASKLSDLLFLDLTDNNIERIDLTNSNLLSEIYTANNKLTELILGLKPELTYLNCNSNFLPELDLSSSTKLEKLICHNNRIGLLNLPNSDSLKIIECYKNRLDALDLKKLISLTYIKCNNNNLSILELPKNGSLKTLLCNLNRIEELELIDQDSLEIINLNDNRLTELNLGSKLFLNKLECVSNSIQKFELLRADSLKSIRMYQNKVVELTLLNCPVLEFLSCHNNSIQYIELNGCPKLKSLVCGFNPLKLLDLSANTKIEYVSFGADLEYLNLANGVDSYFITLNIGFNSDASLKEICADKNETNRIKFQLSGHGISGQSYNISHDCAFPELTGSLNSKLTGTVSYETNEECFKEDSKIEGLQFNILNKYSPFKKIYSYPLGDKYVVRLPAGNYDMDPILNADFPTSSTPERMEVEFKKDSDTTQDICFKPTGDLFTDFDIQVTPLNQARPGFTTKYRLIYNNNGNISGDGSIDFYYEKSIMNFKASSQVMTSEENRLKYDFKNLKPFEQRFIELQFELNSPQDNPPVNGGDQFCFNVNIQETKESLNEVQIDIKNPPDLCQNVVNSYDPNDKRLLQGPYLLDSLIGEYVSYIIRFENTGTADAINVVIEDEIDLSVFDISSFQIVDASHRVYPVVKRNLISFIFDAINLPFDDDNNDGFVLFKIKTLEDLEVGDLLENTASIFFDFNFPIITNTSVTELVTDIDEDGFHNGIDCDDNDAEINPIAMDVSGNGIDEDCDGFDESPVLVNETNIILYPNPVSGLLNVEPLSNGINYKISMYDLNGKNHLNETRARQIDMSNFDTGTYLIFIDDLNSGQRSIEKIVVMR